MEVSYNNQFSSTGNDYSFYIDKNNFEQYVQTYVTNGKKITSCFIIIGSFATSDTFKIMVRNDSLVPLQFNHHHCVVIITEF